MTKQFCALSEVVVESRHRKEFSEKANLDLQESIRNIGLLHAIVLEDDGERMILRAGERRFRAVKDLADFGVQIRYDGKEVDLGFIPYTSWEELTELQRLQIEVDENQQRKDFTWQEAATALAALAKLREMQAGGVRPATKALAEEAYCKGNTPMTPVAAAARAKDELILAKHLHKPEIAKAKTAKEAMQLLKTAERHERNLELAQTVGRLQKSERFQCLNADTSEWVLTLSLIHI